MMRLRLLLCVLLPLAAAVSSHAQWQKTSGPDSVQTLTSASPGWVHAGTRNGLFVSADSGVTWTEASKGLSNRNIQALAVASRTLMFAGSAGGVHRSFDGGANWEPVNSGLTDLDIRSIAFSFPQRTVLVGTSGGVFRSVDSGATWSAFNTGIPTLDVRTVIFNWNRAYAGTDSGVFYLAPDASHWAPMNSGLTNPDVRTMSGPGALYVGTGTGIFLWREFSANPFWTPADGVANTDVRSLSVSAGIPDATGDAGLAGTADGVFWGYPYGTSWKAVNDGLTDLDIRATSLPEVSGPFGYMFVGTETGIWRRPMAEVIPVNIRGVPEPSRGSQLRMNGNNTISFSIPARTFVSLTLQDVSGRTRATLLSKELPAGEHTAPLSTFALPRGMYLVSLRSDVLTDIQPLVLP